MTLARRLRQASYGLGNRRVWGESGEVPDLDRSGKRG